MSAGSTSASSNAIRTAPAEDRWGRRHVAAMTLRTAMVVLPIGGSVAAMAILSRALPTPTPTSGDFPRLAWWAAVLLGSLIAMWCVDRLTRRLAPLVALLDMAVLFPGRAPTRMAVARKAGDLRHLESLSRHARDTNQPNDLADAAVHILSLVGALRAHDRHTRGHSERVRVYTDLIAAQMKLPSAAVDRLRWAALLHDIGKLRVPTETLNKPAKLSSREWEVVRQHPLEGARIAEALLPWLGEWGLAIAEHHERFDGSGYPNGLQGKDISVSGRIVAVSDAFEVMTAPRSYKKAMTRSSALAELVRFSGSQFDPDVVRALLQVSAPRLRWAMGPTSWLVGTPVLGAAPSLTAATVAAQATVGVTAVAVASVTGLGAPMTAASTSGSASPSATPASAVTTPTPNTAAAPKKTTSTQHANHAASPSPTSTASVIATHPAKPTHAASPTHPAKPTQAASPTPRALPTPAAHLAKPTPAAHPAKPTPPDQPAKPTSSNQAQHSANSGHGKP
jgi:putative nucleotidyltransferase with HDIG domain